MPIPSSGALSLNDIQTEFGGTNPISISEYYAGGSFVPAGTTGTNGAVPSSGQISISQFYGTSATLGYIEDIFSTYLLAGTGSDQTIVNGIDLATYGGLLWYKARNLAAAHSFRDSARGPRYSLASNLDAGQMDNGVASTVFNTNGWTQGGGGFGPYNYASWTFRKQAKFFDIVTYTGDGTSGRAISHSLGSIPGVVIVKRTDTIGNWKFYHYVSGAVLSLNTTGSSSAAGNGYPGAVSSTTFTVYGSSDTSSVADVNASGGTYIAYLFAHNAGGFGPTGTDNVITCGYYTGNNDSEVVVNLGYEPQWLLIKRATNADDPYRGWTIFDNIRGMAVTGGATASLIPNSSDAENSTYANSRFLYPTVTGFNLIPGLNRTSAGGEVYIYIAIRRGPMKTPTTGTSVFIPSTVGATNNITVGFPADSYWIGRDGANWRVFDRLRSGYELAFNTTAAEGGFDYYPDYIDWDSNSVWYQNLQNAPLSALYLRRAFGFFDVVCYTGNGTAGRTVSHNLGVVPELIIVKNRTTADYWAVYSAATGNTKGFYLNTSDAVFTSGQFWNNTSPTASVFSVSNANFVNQNNNNLVAYLFATAAGVSKVGSYTGTGALQTINCGFTGGARFVLIKRSDSTGDWFVYNSANGISSGDDPYRILNGTLNLVQGTNYVDTTSVGFQVTAAAPAGLNANGGTYIFLAIA